MYHNVIWKKWPIYYQCFSNIVHVASKQKTGILETHDNKTEYRLVRYVRHVFRWISYGIQPRVIFVFV